MKFEIEAVVFENHGDPSAIISVSIEKSKNSVEEVLAFVRPA